MYIYIFTRIYPEHTYVLPTCAYTYNTKMCEVYIPQHIVRIYYTSMIQL